MNILSTAGTLVVITVYGVSSIQSDFLLRSPITPYSLFPWFSVDITGLHKLWQPGSLAARKRRENEKIKRKWRE